jgi:hypothetical protein
MERIDFHAGEPIRIVLTARSELNMAVAQYVFEEKEPKEFSEGYQYYSPGRAWIRGDMLFGPYVPRPSRWWMPAFFASDPRETRNVLDKMWKRGYVFELCATPHLVGCDFTGPTKDGHTPYGAARDESFEVAVCLAAVRAVSAEIKGPEISWIP